MPFKKISSLPVALSFLYLLSGTPSSAQKLADLTPPSPKAYELGKYGQTPVGLFSGTLQASIPVYTYRTKNLSVPISLSYSSNGIKVDELGSNVGLGWSLNAGGAVTRIIRDLPDGDRNGVCPVDKIHEQGGLYCSEALDYFYNAGNNAGFDSETDLFMFNFNGYNGKFVFDNNHEIIMIPKQDIKIQTVTTVTDDGFKITTADGIVYTFLQKEYSRSRAEGGAQSAASFYSSAWYLSTIAHPNGDVITFVYETEGYNYITSKQQSVTAMPLQTDCSGALVSQAATPGLFISYRLFVSGFRLKEIRSNVPEEGKVLINSITQHPEVSGYPLVTAIQVVDKAGLEMERADFTYLTTSNKRAFLQKVAMKDPANNYVLEYESPANFPLRLSLSQDHWGYFNGANSNTTVFPNLSDPKYAAPQEIANYSGGAYKEIAETYVRTGLLTRINYPTKGYSAFTYEPNTYSGTVTVPPVTASASVEATSGPGQYGVVGTPVNFGPINMDQQAELSFGRDLDVCSSGTGTGTCSIEDLNNPGIEIFSINFSSTGKANVALQNGHSYKLKIRIDRPCMYASASIIYYQGTPSTQQANIITGGVRIQKVIAVDGISATPLTTHYYYGKKESYNISTGEKAVMPSYLSINHNRVSCPAGNSVDLISYEVSSNSINALYNSMGTNTTGYNFVTVSNGGDNFENGGEEHEFILDNDAPANNLLGDFIPAAPWTNIGFANGKEKKVTTFKKSGSTITVLKTQTSTYTQDARYHKETYGYVVQKKYTNPYASSAIYTCSAAACNASYTYYECTKNHDITIGNELFHREHKWGTVFGIQNAICLLPDANNVKKTIYDKCYGLSTTTTFTNPNSIENLNITEYKYNSDWEYLSSVVTTVYDLNGANPITTTQNFFYDNPVHMQLSRTETNNGGSILKEKTYYPDDVTSVSSLPDGDLQPDEFNNIVLLNRDNQYRINTPVQQESYMGTAKRNTVRTIYKPSGSLLLPYIIRTLRGTNAAGNSFRDKVCYSNYDTKGNILEASLTNDVYTSYIWGYNGTYPVAVVKNARPNEIFFDSFEEGTGWDNHLTAYDATRSHTGKYSGRIDRPTATEYYTFPVNWLNIPSGKVVKYHYSVWVYSTGPSADLYLFTKGPNTVDNTNTFVTTSLTNKWVLLEGDYDVPAGANQLILRLDNNGGGSVWFDDVRLHPSAAQMSSFTFQPLVGITSETLPNQQITKYEYDAYNRLKLTRNGDNAILQRYQYKFK